MSNQLTKGSEAQSEKRLGLFRIGLGLAFFVFTLLSYDNQYMRWWYLSIGIGLVVLILQLTHFKLLRIYALWFALFLVIQTLLSAFYLNNNFLTLFPYQDFHKDHGTQYRGIEGSQHITTDAKGFRTTKPVNYQEDDSPLRIFAIGGSTTEQILIDDKQTFTHLLQEKLETRLKQEVEVINTGVSGLRAIHHIATMEHIINLHPDMILILLGVNDWNRQIILNYPDDIPETMSRQWSSGWQTHLRLRNTLLGKILVKLQFSLIENNKTAKKNTAPVNNNTAEKKSNSNTTESGSLNRNDKRVFKPESVSDEYKQHLDTLLTLCKTNGVPCLLITQPNAYKPAASKEKKNSFWMTPPYVAYTLDIESLTHIASLYNNHLIAKAKSEGIHLCDIDAAMAPSFDNFYDDVHFNTSGAQRVSELLLPCVMELLENKNAAVQ